MKKNTIRLRQSELNRIISESINTILTELRSSWSEGDYEYYFILFVDETRHEEFRLKKYFLSDKKAIDAARTLAKEHMKKYYQSKCFVYVLGIDGVDMLGGTYRDFEDRLNQVHVISTQNKEDTHKHLEKTYRQNKKIDEYLRW